MPNNKKIKEQGVDTGPKREAQVKDEKKDAQGASQKELDVNLEAKASSNAGQSKDSSPVAEKDNARDEKKYENEKKEKKNGTKYAGSRRPGRHYDPVAARKLIDAARETIRQIDRAAFLHYKETVQLLAKDLERCMKKRKICAFIVKGLEDLPISRRCIYQALGDEYKDLADAANGRKGGIAAAAAGLNVSGVSREVVQKLKVPRKKIPPLYDFAFNLYGLAAIFAASVTEPGEKYLIIPAGLTYLQEQLLIQQYAKTMNRILRPKKKQKKQMKQPNAGHRVTQMQQRKEKQEEKAGVNGREVKQHVAGATQKEEGEQALQQPREITGADNNRNAEPPTSYAHGQPQPEEQQLEKLSGAEAGTHSEAIESKTKRQQPTVESISSSKKGRQGQHNHAQEEEKIQEPKQLPDALELGKVIEDSKDYRVLEFNHPPQQPDYGSQPEYPSPLKPRSNYYPYPPSKEEEQQRESKEKTDL